MLDDQCGRLADVLRPDDLLVVSQLLGEPTTVLERLADELESSAALPQLFAGISHSDVLAGRLSERTRMMSYCAIGTLGTVAAAGRLGIVPVNYADVPRVLRMRGRDGIVVLLQVSAAGADGRHSLGLNVDYAYELLEDARLVIAEVNEQLPVTSAPRILASRLDVVVPVSRAHVTVPSAEPDEVQRMIAAHAATIIPDGTVLQVGIGAVAAAVARLLAGRRRLRVHTAVVGNWLLDLHRAGALDASPGAVTCSGAAGSAELYRLIADQARFAAVSEVNPVNVLAGVERFVAVNSAVQVDLTGQVNAEIGGTRYLGGVGGHSDFQRGGQLSRGGLSIVVLPATAARATVSRIVPSLDAGVVTTGRACVDFVVTEHGIADLRDRTIAERINVMLSIAAPEHRPALESASNAVAASQ